MTHLTAFLVVCLVFCTYFTSAQDSYAATVVEYARTGSMSGYNNVIERTVEYVEVIAKSQKGIVVFPEYGLTTPYLPSDLDDVSTVVPDPSENVTPCLNTALYKEHLIRLSCAAKSHFTHVVVNLVEQANATDDSTIYYNTNVVFDSAGKVIARYRKINLCNEPMFAKGENISTFSAFDVNFGLMTSCDLLFSHPARTLLKSNVTDIIYPHAWISETPFLQSLSLQDGFAKATGVNFISGSYRNHTAGYGGAAVFQADATTRAIAISTAIGYSWNDTTVQKITSRTPGAVCDNNIDKTPRFDINWGGQLPGIDRFYTTVENMDLYTFKDLEVVQNESRVQVCSEGSSFCCDFYVKFNHELNTTSTPIYKAVAFYGSKRVNATSQTLGFRSCGLVACDTSDDRSCGGRASAINVSFDSITVNVSLPLGDDALYMPSTLTSNLKPIEKYVFCKNENKEENQLGITMSINRVDNLLTFGIVGRVYDLDGQPEGRGTGTNVRCAFGLILLMFVSHLLVV